MTFIDRNGMFWVNPSLDEIALEIAECERQKRKIDRIAQKAEAAQRFAKGGHWV